MKRLASGRLVADRQEAAEPMHIPNLDGSDGFKSQVFDFHSSFYLFVDLGNSRHIPMVCREPQTQRSQISVYVSLGSRLLKAVCVCVCVCVWQTSATKQI